MKKKAKAVKRKKAVKKSPRPPTPLVRGVQRGRRKQARKDPARPRSKARQTPEQLAVEVVKFNDIEIGNGDPFWLADQMFPLASTAMIVGEPNTGKTLLTAEIALAVAAGGRVLNRFKALLGRVLIHSPEMKLASMKARIVSAANRKGIAFAGLDIEFTPKGMEILLDKPDKQRALEAIIDDRRPALVIIDPLAECIAGSENVQKVAGLAINFLKNLGRKYHFTCILVHHAANGRARGSSVWRAAVDACYILTETNGSKLLTCVKQRDAARLQPLPLAITEVGGNLGIEIVESPAAVEGKKESTSERIARQELEFIDQNPGCSFNMIDGGVIGYRLLKSNILKGLIKTEAVRKDERGGHHIVIDNQVVLKSGSTGETSLKFSDKTAGSPAVGADMAHCDGFVDNNELMGRIKRMTEVEIEANPARVADLEEIEAGNDVVVSPNRTTF